jgi:hypothetical protein
MTWENIIHIILVTVILQMKLVCNFLDKIGPATTEWQVFLAAYDLASKPKVGVHCQN